MRGMGNLCRITTKIKNKKMKILLTCTSIQDEHRVETEHDSHYPLGLAYLQSYIEHHRPNKDEFMNLYLNNVDYRTCYSTLKKALKEFKPDIFGISIMTHSRVSAFRMIEYAHEHHPDAQIVLGGIHVTIMWKQIVEKYPYVIVVRGEGEETFNKLVETLEKKDKIDNIPGLAWHDGKEIKTTGSPPLIEDISTLPFPKHELFVNEGKTIANLLTSRGCPYKCNFCVLDWMSRRKVRFRSGDNIADEVQMILEKFPSIKTIWIHDDAFMINKDRTIEFCDAIIERGIKTQFIASARFRPISEEVVRKMEQAGFVQVLFGLESGADNVISGMRKGITKEHVRYGMELFAKTNMKATAFLIAGLPGETDETIQETIDFVQEIQNINYLYYDDMGVAAIYPGTEMYTMARATEKINDDYWLTDGDVPMYTIENGGVHTLEKLEEMKRKIRQAVALRYLFDDPEAFLVQRKLIPSILKYAQQHNLGAINAVTAKILSEEFDAETLSHAVFFGASEQMINTICGRFEKWLIEMLVKKKRFPTPKERNQFISKYNIQKQQDKATLLKYEQRRKEIIQKLGNKEDIGDVEYISKRPKTNKSKKLDFEVSTNGGV